MAFLLCCRQTKYPPISPIGATWVWFHAASITWLARRGRGSGFMEASGVEYRLIVMVPYPSTWLLYQLSYRLLPAILAEDDSGKEVPSQPMTVAKAGLIDQGT